MRAAPPAQPFELILPEWAQVSERRRGHIARVTALLDTWAVAMELDRHEAQEWHDVGRWHDALRDAPDDLLRALARDAEAPVKILHGPAAAAKLAADGERRESVLSAVRWHTLGDPTWGRTGRALFMADFLEPGRAFSQADRAFLAQHVPTDFDGVFRQVVRARLEWTIREGNEVYPGTVALWNAVR